MAFSSEPNLKALSTKPAQTSLTRRQQLVKLLGRKSGATVAQLQNAFGWQPHTARVAKSTLRKAGTLIEGRNAAKGAVCRNVWES